MSVPVFVGFTQGDTSGSAASLTFSHTVPSGSNRALFVGISAWQQAISSVTFNGVGLSAVSGSSLGAADVRSSYWVLAAPPVTTANVVITPASSTWLSAGASNWTNVDQTTPASHGTCAGNVLGHPSLSVTSDANAMVLDVLAWWNQVTPTVGAGQTSIWIETEATNDNKSAGSYATGAGSVTMQWTLAAETFNWAMSAVSINGISSGIGTTSTPIILW